MALDGDQLVKVLEASLLVAGRPLNLGQIDNLFEHEAQRDRPSREAIREALAALQEQYEGRGVELVEVASGYRIQARQQFAPFVANLFQEKTPRYSRALLETLVLIAYRQPITRGEVEDVRGVAVSTNIIKTLMEREWVRVLGHRDVPGRPAIYGTTRQFLDYFNLKRIDELPTLSEIKELDQIDPDLAREMALLESRESEAEGEGGIDSDGETPTDTERDAENESESAVDSTAMEAESETEDSQMAEGQENEPQLESDQSSENTKPETSDEPEAVQFAEELAIENEAEVEAVSDELSADQTVHEIHEESVLHDATAVDAEGIDVDLGDDDLDTEAEPLTEQGQPVPEHSLSDTVH